MAQSQLSAHALGEAGGAAHWSASQPSFTGVTKAPARIDIPQVLSAWRAAERQLAAHIEASPMRSLIQSEITRLRAEYQRLFAQANR